MRAAPPLRLGDVALARAAAAGVEGAGWRLLRAACRGGDDWPAPLLQPVLPLDGAVDEARLPAPVRAAARALAGLDAAAAQARLRDDGFECPSLYWGAWSGALDDAPWVLWRCDPGAVGDRPERVSLPLYPVLRRHAARAEPVVHAAAVAGTRAAALLLGPSGAGKSTAARHAAAAGGVALCDDGVVIAGGTPPVAVPLPSVAAVGPDSAPPRPARLPIAAFCFLAQADADRLTAMGRAEAIRRLAAACFLEVPPACWLPRPLRAALFDRLCELAAAVPSFTLALRPGPAYFHLLRRELPLDG